MISNLIMTTYLIFPFGFHEEHDIYYTILIRSKYMSSLRKQREIKRYWSAFMIDNHGRQINSYFWMLFYLVFIQRIRIIDYISTLVTFLLVTYAYSQIRHMNTLHCYFFLQKIPFLSVSVTFNMKETN